MPRVPAQKVFRLQHEQRWYEFYGSVLFVFYVVLCVFLYLVCKLVFIVVCDEVSNFFARNLDMFFISAVQHERGPRKPKISKVSV